MIAQRTVLPFRPHPAGTIGDPLFFEKFFRERGMPLIIHASMNRRTFFDADRESGAEQPADSSVYRRRRSIEDRVRDVREGSKAKEGSFYRARPDAGSKAGGFAERRDLDKSTRAAGHSWLCYLFVIVLLLGVGLAGFYFGKVAESRNYVRVPSNN